MSGGPQSIPVIQMQLLITLHFARSNKPVQTIKYVVTLLLDYCRSCLPLEVGDKWFWEVAWSVFNLGRIILEDRTIDRNSIYPDRNNTDKTVIQRRTGVSKHWLSLSALCKSQCQILYIEWIYHLSQYHKSVFQQENQLCHMSTHGWVLYSN